MSTREEKLLIAVSRLRNLMHRELEVVFRMYGLTTTQFSVLEVLKHKGSKSVGEIQKLVLGTNGNIPLVIKNLERDELIIREKPENDKRISIISLSPKGKEIVQVVYLQQKEKLEDLFSNFSDEELKTLTDKIFDVYNRLR
ncbi:MarR family winged helix-turn-helix transcriptional regulator [Streptobacillus canis]|uniref:MarR family winged helix-turn-helix transcriptional regulator n=1 Tax=Streptobacillus canis TaxID=2678686 RepID=UPI0012E28A50|nr:MarR family transcriptional regulator [Streptobacillus canis]